MDLLTGIPLLTRYKVAVGDNRNRVPHGSVRGIIRAYGRCRGLAGNGACEVEESIVSCVVLKNLVPQFAPVSCCADAKVA
jgi:hypothetical protein